MIRRNYLFTIIVLCLPIVSNSPAEAQNYTQYGNPAYSGFAGSNAVPFNNGFSGFSGQAAVAQANRRVAPASTGQRAGSSMSSLEQTLDAVDNQAAWARTPVSVPAAAGSSGRTVSAGPQPAARSGNSSMFAGVSRQEMMRVFLEGGSPQRSSPAGGGQPASNNNAVNTAYSNYQTARNEESKSRNYANTARYNSSKWNRKDAASQAEYAANNANYAAQRAESAAYSGGQQAQSYANLARQCANRARANADRARYNADTIQ